MPIITERLLATKFGDCGEEWRRFLLAARMDTTLTEAINLDFTVVREWVKGSSYSNFLRACRHIREFLDRLPPSGHGEATDVVDRALKFFTEFEARRLQLAQHTNTNYERYNTETLHQLIDHSARFGANFYDMILNAVHLATQTPEDHRYRVTMTVTLVDEVTVEVSAGDDGEAAVKADTFIRGQSDDDSYYVVEPPWGPNMVDVTKVVTIAKLKESDD